MMLGPYKSYVVIDSCHNHRPYHEQPIRHGDVQLSVEHLARVNSLDLGKV
jgi:hypothetical protein